MDLFGKPVIVLGQGVRASSADPAQLLELGVPILTSWQTADLVDNFHPAYFGRPGIYGQRCANKIFYEADTILTIGCRLAPYMIGYAGLRKEQRLIMVDADPREAFKFTEPKAEFIHSDAKAFIEAFNPNVSCHAWLKACERWREQWPWVEHPTHDDMRGYINSYQFTARLQPFLRPDEMILVDNGGTMCPFFQALKLKPPQRLLASGNLGEMGATLPGAIGASLARGRGEVLAVIGDGSMMMNVQELATLVHYQLPVKIILVENDGYAMIKGTYDNLKKPRKGVSKGDGLGMPDFEQMLRGFGIETRSIREWEHFDNVIPELLGAEGPMAAVLHIDPEQAFLPKLQPVIKDGVITPARFDQLSPLLEAA